MTAPALVFLYDRCATRSTATADARLDGCRTHAARLGWDVAGAWVERGDFALCTDRRPRLDALCRAMTLYATQRPVLCLVHHWERLCRHPAARDRLRRRISRSGGGTATAFGELDTYAHNLLGPAETHP